MVDPERIREAIVAESVLVDRQGVVALYEAIHKMVGFGLGGLLYRAGKTGGMQGARLLADRFQLQGEDLLQALLIAFNTARWGRAELNRTTEPWTLHIYDSVLGQHLKSKKPVCHPIAGYWAGFLQTALGKEVQVREVQCMAQGHDHCVFEIQIR